MLRAGSGAAAAGGTLRGNSPSAGSRAGEYPPFPRRCGKRPERRDSAGRTHRQAVHHNGRGDACRARQRFRPPPACSARLFHSPGRCGGKEPRPVMVYRSAYRPALPGRRGTPFPCAGGAAHGRGAGDGKGQCLPPCATGRTQREPGASSVHRGRHGTRRAACPPQFPCPGPCLGTGHRTRRRSVRGQHAARGGNQLQPELHGP